ncbi:MULTISPECIES: hypothetical protein [Sphingomonas]|uniref:hypothetical protein n=1 Tax=Sphingomonas TaxID=13687 RepID=UPI000A5EED69|nr:MULTISPECIES: hypothetical protein [Sphingomonas]
MMTDGERSGSGSDKDALEVVLITGASGFTAAALVAQPRERYTVVGLDRVGPPDPRPPASAIGYDITGNPNPLYDKATVHDTRRLIDGLRSFDVEQFVFASTMLVHKPAATPEERISEESPIGAS